MEWTAESVRILRKRLGWTVSDMARRLGCSSELIQQLESCEDLTLDSDIRTQLEYLNLQLEKNSKHIRSRPVVERLLNQSHKDQLSVSELDDMVFESKTKNLDE